MVRTFSAYLDFTYLVRRSNFDEHSLSLIKTALDRFYTYRPIFQETGVREPGPAGFLLPRQHSMKHYLALIAEFGAPNGLCSSITESKHIRAIKDPWRSSSHNEPMKEMMMTNQRLDKLAAARVDFCQRGMLMGGVANPGAHDDGEESDDDGGAVEAPLLNHVVLARTKGTLGCSLWIQ